MPSRNEKGELFFKILYWGPTKSGKTQTVEKLYEILEATKDKGIPVSVLTKISVPGGDMTIFFDRGVIRVGSGVFFQIYTVAGHRRFKPLRKVIYYGADGVVFVMNSLRRYWNLTVESLRELKDMVSKHNQILVEQIPLIIQVNSFESGDRISLEEIVQLLKDEGLYHYTGSQSKWNPSIHEVYDFEKEKLLEPFADIASRILSYWYYGRGRAPPA